MVVAETKHVIFQVFLLLKHLRGICLIYSLSLSESLSNDLFNLFLSIESSEAFF
jgi:hypothetical protein